MKFKDLKIGTQLNLGFAVLLVLVVVLGLVAYRQTSLVHSQTSMLYEHPLQVRRALGALQTDIVSIQLEMMVIFIVSNPDEYPTHLAHLADYEADFMKNLQIVDDSYLGPHEDVDALEAAYRQWQIMYRETLRLFLEGTITREDARAMHVGVRGEQADALQAALQKVDEFSRLKGDSLYAESGKLTRNLSIQLIIITAFSLLLVFLVVSALVRAIRDPILSLTQVTRRYQEGELEARSLIQGQNEIGELSASFNQMADKIGGDFLLLEERNRALLAAQEQLVRQERLALLGQLAGSVSHELRNPLGVINNSVYYLKATQPEMTEDERQYLGYIEQEVRNAEKIISDLLTFTRSLTPNREQIAIPNLVAEVLRQAAVPPVVPVGLDLPEDLPYLFADRRHLFQVLLNLVVNACQAMPDGGRLEIKADLTPEGELPWLRLAVRDTGIGIPPEDMPKIFEPLFTTKARGIGLGLAICRRLVQANGGRIEVESWPGQGSTFTILLPLEPPPPAG